MNSLIIRLLIALFLLPAFAQSQHIVKYPRGKFQDTDAEDFLARNLPSKYYNELWTYHINLDNGVQIVYTFSINDFGAFKGRVTGVKLFISWKDGKTYVVNKEYSPDTFVTDGENNYIRLHPDRPYWAKGSFDDTHRLFFHNTKDGIQHDVDLTFYDIAQGKILGNGVYSVDNDEIGISLLMPHAKVRGIVAINGDTVKATGVGYMDHVYQNNLSSEIIDRTYRIKTGNAQNGMFFHFVKLRKTELQTPIGYGVAYKNGIAEMITPTAIQQLSSDKKTRELDNYVMIKPFQTDSLNIRVKKHLNTYSLINELSGIKKFLAKKVIGGELVEMHGTVTINDKQPGYFYYMVAK